MNTATHTPTPWLVSDFDYTTVYAEIEDGDFHQEPGICSCDGEAIAKIEDRDVRRANAAFIVRACNAYDELVAALREYDDAFTEANFSVQSDRMRMRKAIIQARAALAKAGAA